MRFELFVGSRYLQPKKGKGFFSFSFFLSTFIVSLGVFILIVVISVMGGFQQQIKDTLLQADSHILIRHKPKGNIYPPLENYSILVKKIKEHSSVVWAMPFIKGDGILRKSGFIKPVQVRGVPIDAQTREVPKSLKEMMVNYFGEKLTVPSRLVLPKGKSMLVGYEIKNEFNLDSHTEVELIVPQGSMTAKVGLNPVVEEFKVRGYFKSGYYTYDSSLIYISMDMAGKLYGVGDKAYGIAVKIKDLFDSERVRDEIVEQLGLDYMGYTIQEQNENLFRALHLEKGVMSILLFLIILAAAFNIMGTLIWLVMDKRHAIGILKSLGASSRSILLIFLFQGFFIGVIGTAIGAALGIITAMNMEGIIQSVEAAINAVMSFVYSLSGGYWADLSIVPKIYYVEGFPSQVEPDFVLWVVLLTIAITTLSGLVPAYQAAKLHPVETMRYE